MRSARREAGSPAATTRAQSPRNVKPKTTMKQSISSLGAFGLLSSIALAGSTVTDMAAPAPVASSDGFAQARRPISNPTLFDLALPTTNVHPIFFYHSLPDSINTTLGPLDVGGHVELYALQAEFADQRPLVDRRHQGRLRGNAPRCDPQQRRRLGESWRGREIRLHPRSRREDRSQRHDDLRDSHR